MTMKPIRLLELTPANLARIAGKKPLLLMPIGTVEWHASHLPVGVDSLTARVVCEEISAQTGVVIAPLLSTGICRDLQPERGYFGTVDTIREETLSSLVADLLEGYAKMGFRQAVVFSGHFEREHFSALTAGIERVSAIQGIFMTALDWIEDLVEELEDVSLSWPYAGDHAAEWETSLMLHLFPELVQMENAPETLELDMEGLPEYIRKRYPRRASKEYGADIYDAIIRKGTEAIQRLLDTLI
jgi:creatinine amidohydrolase